MTAWLRARSASDSTPNAAADASAAPTHVVSVLVVDDQLPFRAVARTVVRVASGFDVVGEAETGRGGVGQGRDARS
jgi:hypothetical protein